MIAFQKAFETNVSLGEGVVFIEQVKDEDEAVFIEIPLEHVEALCLTLKSAQKCARGGDR